MTAVILELPRREEDAPEKVRRRVLDWLIATFRSEQERYVLWLPAFIGIGIALYFLLPVEPPLIAGLVLGAILISAAYLLPRALRRFLIVPAAALALGFLAGVIRTESAKAPVLSREIYATITGHVRWIEPLEDGRARLVIDVAAIDRLSPAETPKRVRVSLRGLTTWPAIGDLIEMQASLSPPAGPIAPGAYDYARIAYFAGIGASGYGGDHLRILTPAQSAESGISRWFAHLRSTIEARINKALPQREAGVATALIVGARGGISEDDTKAMQNAGVSHVLSISGLHLALVAGLVFILMRGGLALIEPVALSWPIKKIAAIAALLGAGFYVGISDGSAPIIRSFLMFAVAMLALLIDRPALSLRTVAFAAAALLLFSPESLLDPSFEMSFAAVVALVAAYEWIGSKSWSARALPWIVRSVLATAVTSLVAEIATAPFAAYHFNQFQAYGLIANEVVVPLLGFFIMPLAALSVLAMPFGLEDWPLKGVGFGIDQMLSVAHWTSELPGAVTYLTAWPPMALVLIVLGGLWLCLWKRTWRLGGIAVAAIGVAMALLSTAPDAFIGEEGDKLAFRVRKDGEWQYGLLGVKPASFRGEAWLKRLGADPLKPLGASSLVRCDALGCAVPLGEGKEISIVRDGRAIAEECASAKVLVSLLRVQTACDAPLVLDWPKIRNGAVALRFSGDAPRAELPPASRRPWQHPAFPNAN